jgi:hypothetical protein
VQQVCVKAGIAHLTFVSLLLLSALAVSSLPRAQNQALLHLARYVARPVGFHEGGRGAVIPAECRLAFEEAHNQPRSIDDLLTLIEDPLRPGSLGEGRTSTATNVSLNRKDNTGELDQDSSNPVRRQKVKKVERE